mgnify:CR=1 FL=1
MLDRTHNGLPRFLLVEDDAISSGFFKVALESLPAQVDLAENMARALELASGTRHTLYMIDANLPDGHGSQLLARLHALHPGVPALAHSADASPGLHDALRQAGFTETFTKPLGRDALLKAVRRCLVRTAGSAAEFSMNGVSESTGSDWDETTALAALNGQRTHLIALRELFLAELPSARDAVDSAISHHDDLALRSQLHRLQASCGFVGAARLARAVRQLHKDPASLPAQHQFHDAVASLLH